MVFVKKWKSGRQKCGAQVEDDQLCKICREKYMSPVIARQLVYFFSISQVWDFLDVAMKKPHRAMEACTSALNKLRPVKPANSECLRKRYEKLRAIVEQAKSEGF